MEPLTFKSLAVPLGHDSLTVLLSKAVISVVGLPVRPHIQSPSMHLVIQPLARICGPVCEA